MTTLTKKAFETLSKADPPLLSARDKYRAVTHLGSYHKNSFALAAAKKNEARNAGQPGTQSQATLTVQAFRQKKNSH